MRIGMILDLGEKEYPPDIRVDKEARVLSDAGHKVFILTRRVPRLAPVEERLNSIGATVVRAQVVDGRFRKLGIAYRAITLHDSRWKRAISQFIEKYEVEILHVHDLLILPTALSVAKHFGLAVVSDLHENLPAAKRSYRSSYSLLKKLQEAIVWNYHLMRFHEARALRRCVRTIVVVPEATGRILSYGVRPERVVVVSNSEDETTFGCKHRVGCGSLEGAYGEYWLASYIGGVGPHRGVDTVLRAVPHVRQRIPNFRLLIVGADDNAKRWITEMTEDLEIRDLVVVLGWQSFERVCSYIVASDVCLVPHKDFEHTQTTVPHKLFQYMICGKPVLVSNCRPLARIVSESKCGRVFKAGCVESFVNELIWMRQHPTKTDEMGRNGRYAALGRFAWRTDAAVLMKMYAELGGD